MSKLRKDVTLRYIRSIIGKKEKITMERAIELIKADRGHAQYNKSTIKKLIKQGVLIQLTNHTLQMVGVGIDTDSRTFVNKNGKARNGNESFRECQCWACVREREEQKRNSKKALKK